jgi:hypothetical protein
MHPYQQLGPEAFWRQGVAERNPLHFEDVYTPRFEISRETRIAAAGSCFAQHIGQQFKRRGYSFLDTEPPPPLLDAAQQHAFGYDLYSARYGNLYTVRQLVQLLKRATGEFVPEDDVWVEDGRLFDPYRPTIEPNGFATTQEFEASRVDHYDAVARILPQADLFVFTFGLTESWMNTADGAVYPTCPGTVHGEFDPGRHQFVNFSWPQIMEDFESFLQVARSINPEMRFLVTVSPVPLTATASGQHVLAASMASKSILRAVCAELYARYDYVDYFPSYELVASHPMRAMFFDPNLRTVAANGVAHVMDTFFRAHGDAGPGDAAVAPEDSAAHPGSADSAMDEDDVVCEEALLEVFGS